MSLYFSLDFGEIRTKDIPKFLTAKGTPDNSDSHEAISSNKPLANNSKKAKRLSVDTQRSLATILPRGTQKKQEDLLSVLLSRR